LLINILCSFYPTITFKLSFYTRSILICITFALFCFQVAFCSFWEHISIINYLIIEICFQKNHISISFMVGKYLDFVVCFLRSPFFFCLLFFFQQKEK